MLRPLWDIGLVTPEGVPDLRTARIWVEHQPVLEPGAHAAIRLASLVPHAWRHLRPGDRIAMHEQMPVAGTATIMQTSPPTVLPKVPCGRTFGQALARPYREMP